MYCSKCGTQIDEAVNFFPKCGSAVEDFSGTEITPTKPKTNPFAFVSAGIMAVMLVLHFFPWFYSNTKTYSLFGYYISRMPVTESPSIFYIVLIVGAMGLLIAGIITTVIRKNRIPMVFAIVSSALIHQTPIVYLLSVEAWTVGVTEIPFIIFALTFVNIAFAIPAKIR